MARERIHYPEPPEWLLIARPDALLKLTEVAKILGVSRQLVRYRVEQGKFPKPDPCDKARREWDKWDDSRSYWRVSTVRKFLKQQAHLHTHPASRSEKEQELL
jgi:predicted DNA-binding transcriptional regulator AlpA